MFLQWVLAIYLLSDLLILGYGLVAMLRYGSGAHQVLALTLVWPWLVLRTLAKDGLTLLSQLKVIVHKTWDEIRISL